MGYVKMVGTANRHTNWTSEVVLEVDEEGNPTKTVTAGAPTDLSADDQKKLEDMGFVFESSSKKEAEEYQESQAAGVQVGGDVAQAAPIFGSSEAPDQAADGGDEG